MGRDHQTNRERWFDLNDLEKLAQYYPLRHTIEEDPLKAIAEHRELACRWWRKGHGILVHGPGFRPALVLAEREGRR